MDPQAPELNLGEDIEPGVGREYLIAHVTILQNTESGRLRSISTTEALLLTLLGAKSTKGRKSVLAPRNIVGLPSFEIFEDSFVAVKVSGKSWPRALVGG